MRCRGFVKSLAVIGVIVPWLIVRVSATTIMTCGLLVLAAGRALIAAAHTIPVLSTFALNLSLALCVSSSAVIATSGTSQQYSVAVLVYVTRTVAFLICDQSRRSAVVADLLVALGGATSGSVLPSLFSLEAPPGGVGTLLGVGQSVHSAAGVMGPLISGALFERYGPGAPSTMASGLCLLAVVVFISLVGNGDGVPRTKSHKAKAE